MLEQIYNLRKTNINIPFWVRTEAPVVLVPATERGLATVDIFQVSSFINILNGTTTIEK